MDIVSIEWFDRMDGTEGESSGRLKNNLKKKLVTF